jgi:Tfp pilus assembly protein PilE
MGQQQLLLIVLGVIIVGIAVVVGINVFTASAMQANRDATISDLTNLASLAQQHYRKPTALGGGGNTFTGWTIPASIDTTGNGTYAATVAAQTLTLVGKGTEKGNNGTAVVQVTMVVSPDKITSTTINN